jgi:hypothetical protein
MTRKFTVYCLVAALLTAGYSTLSIDNATAAKRCKAVSLYDASPVRVLSAASKAAKKDRQIRRILSTASGMAQDLAMQSAQSGWAGYDDGRYDADYLAIELLDRAGYYLSCKEIRR